jgi:glycosyltransferase involved in cell wall biosynthesis
MIPLIYSLHSGNLYGTERMALATADGLKGEFDVTFYAPAGPIHDEAKLHGFKCRLFEGKAAYFRDIRPIFAAISTRVTHTLACEAWARLYGRRCANIQVVHGGTDERLSYGSKKWLDRLAVKQVAVSKYVKERMIANGVKESSITVIENFLSPERVESAPQRSFARRDAVRKVIIVSRLDPIKRVDLLLDALGLEPALRDLQFEIYGSGSDEAILRARALNGHPNVKFMGFSPFVPEEMANADMLLHLCPEEPFGLAILEAMAAAVPVMVPNSGGAGDLVEPGRTGFHFHANDAWSLANELKAVMQPEPNLLKTIAIEAMKTLYSRFSAKRGIAQYAQLIHSCLN